jgi:hypothetical protein
MIEIKVIVIISAILLVIATWYIVKAILINKCGARGKKWCPLCRGKPFVWR